MSLNSLKIMKKSPMTKYSDFGQKVLWSQFHLSTKVGIKELLLLTKLIELRATPHMTLRAHDHCTSSTHIGGKARASPSSLHTTLEGPTERRTNRLSECQMNVRCIWISMWHQMDHVSWSLELISKTSSWR